MESLSKSNTLAQVQSYKRHRTSSILTFDSPLNRVLDAIRAHGGTVKQRGDNYTCTCPAHDDRNPSLSVGEDVEGKVLVKCYAGCTFEAIVDSLGLSPTDFFPAHPAPIPIARGIEPNHQQRASASRGRTTPSTHEPPPSLASFGEARGFTTEELATWGVEQDSNGLRFPYHTDDGGIIYKKRTHIAAKQGTFWPKGVPLTLFGRQMRELARSNRFAFFVEGETDTFTLWKHDIPAYGVPGVQAVRDTVTAADLDGLDHIYIVYENDEPRADSYGRVRSTPGVAFIAAFKEHLSALGWRGEAKVVMCPDGLNDINDLYRDDPTRFTERLRESVRTGIPLAAWEVPLADQRAEDSPFSGLVRVWLRPEPAPRKFLIGTLVPDGFITQFYGDVGQGKSYIALAMAIHVVLGRPFLGLPVERRTALYLDAELDAEEFVRRAYQIARGLGLEKPPEGLYYYQLPGSLADTKVREGIEQRIAESGAGFLVLDSLTIGSFGADMKEADAVTGVMKAMEAWGLPMVAIDHIAKPMAGANQSQSRAFGSVFKGNVARSAIQVVKAEGGGLTLLHKKANFGPLAEPRHLVLDFDDNRVALRAIDGDDPLLEGAEANLPARERTALALAGYPQGISATDLANELTLSSKTVSNQLTALKKEGRAESANGLWRPVIKGQVPPLAPPPDDDEPMQLAF